jgi:hypothetical protein
MAAGARAAGEPYGRSPIRSVSNIHSITRNRLSATERTDLAVSPAARNGVSGLAQLDREIRVLGDGQ